MSLQGMLATCNSQMSVSRKDISMRNRNHNICVWGWFLTPFFSGNIASCGYYCWYPHCPNGYLFLEIRWLIFLSGPSFSKGLVLLYSQRPKSSPPSQIQIVVKIRLTHTTGNREKAFAAGLFFRDQCLKTNIQD